LMKGGMLETIGSTLVVPSMGTYATHLGVLDLTLDTSDGTIESFGYSTEYLGPPLEPDESIVGIIDAWNAPLAGSLDSAVGYFASPQEIGDMGLMLADSIYEHTNPDVATYNYGGVRESVDGGFITYRDLYRVEPFFNYIATVEMKGTAAESVVAGNYHVTSISGFEPDTWYIVASSNFSITEFEMFYPSDTRNRQDYVSDSVVAALADYLTQEYPMTRSSLLGVIDQCQFSIDSLPDSCLTSGVPGTIRAQLLSGLLDTGDAIEAEDDQEAIAHLLTVIDSLTTHVSCSCARRWLLTNSWIILSYLGYSSTTMSQTTRTQSGQGGPTSPLVPILVLELAIAALVIVYMNNRMKKMR
jgi:hypothetical protein